MLVPGLFTFVLPRARGVVLSRQHLHTQMSADIQSLARLALTPNVINDIWCINAGVLPASSSEAELESQWQVI